MKFAKFTLTPPIVAISVMLLTLTSAASTGVLRVAMKGTGDGSSWESPIGVISNALARADELVKAGTYDHVEIWIKEGRHIPVTSGYKTYANLPSEVTLCGGFAGDETSADQADPAAHPTYISGDLGLNGVWTKDGSDHVNIWIDASTVQEPNPGGTNDYWGVDKGGSGYDYMKGLVYSGAVSNVCFKGLWFVGGFSDFVIGPKDASCTLSACMVTNCQFVGCMAGLQLIHFRGQDNLVTHCSFRGNGGGVSFSSPTNRVASGWLPKTARMLDCEFIENRGICVHPSDSVAGGWFLMSNCVFRLNYNGAGSDVLVSVAAGGQYAVTNQICECLFESNRVRKAGVGLIGMAGAGYQNGSRVEILRSSFIGNTATNATATGAICIHDKGWQRVWVVRDTLFSGNVDTSVANATRASAVALSGTSASGIFENCTFVSNVVDLANASARAATIYVGGAAAQQLGMVHCILKDNVLATGSSGRAADVTFLNPGNANGRFSAVNTIFSNASDGYRPYAFSVNGTYKVRFADICCYHPAGIDESCVEGLVDLSRWDYPVTDTPVFTDLKKGPNGAFAIGVYADPVTVGKKALPVFINDDGNMRFYDPEFGGKDKPYFALHSFGYGSSQSPVTAKCTTSNPLLPDAFGVARRFKRSALGPLNAPNPGLMLLLR